MLIGDALLQLLEPAVIEGRDVWRWGGGDDANFPTTRVFVFRDWRRIAIRFHPTDDRKRIIQCLRPLIEDSNSKRLITESFQERVTPYYFAQFARLAWKPER